MSGQVSYLKGLAAEQAVTRHYQAQGCTLLATRWRGKGGEIDLIFQANNEVIFVEVKASKDHGAAALRLSPRQIGRLFNTAAEFLGTQPAGQDTPSRFDVALVDQAGRIEVLENALCA